MPKLYVCLSIILCFGHFVKADGLTQKDAKLERVRRSPTLQDRENCNEGADVPASRVDTTSQLSALRNLMNTPSDGNELQIQAYIIPMDEEHQSEYVSEHDKRLGYISGFSGSAGLVVVTSQYAALWTDGRYFLQAEAELDCNWILMKEGVGGTPSATTWIGEELNAGDRVGADPSVLSYDKWTRYGSALEKMNISINEASKNLVDVIWNDDGSRPPKPTSDLLILNTSYSGETWESKVERIRIRMRENGVTALIVNYLDESAWLYNLRGEDIVYNPVFFSYSIVELTKTSLYILIANDRLQESPLLRSHLHAVYGDEECHQNNCVHVYDYDDFYANLGNLAKDTPGKVWVSPMSSYQIYSAIANVDSRKVYLAPSFVRLLKGRKNPTEISGMRNSQKRDSAALVEFIAMLEKSVQSGDRWTEMSAAYEVSNYRSAQPLFRGLSFAPISGSGSNGAIIHYRATNLTDKAITTKEMYLLDSGGQYLDGTTDVTRTFHFGQPTDFEKEAYTRVLMGSIDLAMANWPNGTYGRDIDILARQPLWSVGLQYRHGTGHGLGAFLNVHEGPGRINYGYRASQYESPLYGEMFLSDEPGYYEEGKFGVRLETIVMTKKVLTKYEFGESDWLGFEPFTLVPFEPHLIEFELLNSAQRKWLNHYNSRCLQEVGVEILKAQNKMAAYDWVKVRTEPIPDVFYLPEAETSSATSIFKYASFLSVFICVFLVI